ncbi:MAG: histidine kinase [Bacteroidetes bacterium]|nr:histidine kinase [Bacteroidota bacterium]
MKRFFSLILILNLLKSGAHIPDSLLLISQQLKTDTDKVNLFYKWGFNNRSADPQLSFECAKYAEEYAKKSNLPFYIAKASNLLGILYFRKHDLRTALFYHKQALRLRTDINHLNGIAMSETNLGNLYSELKHYEAAEKSYLKALEINTHLNDQKQADNCLLNLGVLKTEQKEFESGKYYFSKVLNNASLRYDYELEAMCLNNLAVINIEMNEIDEAIANCNNSIKMKELSDNEMEQADSYLNLALAYFKKKDLKSGLESIETADSIITKFNYISAKISSLKLKADHYKEQKNYESAFNYLAEYHQLKDSIQSAEKLISLNTDFTDFKTETRTVNAENFHFPYLYLNLLIALLILVFIFIFKSQQ